jgi:GNAT superfamily N-acetyltransferase
MNDTSHFPQSNAGVAVKSITPADLSAIVEMLGEFAAFEEHGEPVGSTEESLDAAMFIPRLLLIGFIAYRDGEPAGFILGSEGYSTYAARPRLLIEDLYVRAHWRGSGLGRELISAFARRCADRGYAELRWRLSAGNTPALRFYSSIGAAMSNDWHDCSLKGEALKALAGGGASTARHRFVPGNGRLLGR